MLRTSHDVEVRRRWIRLGLSLAGAALASHPHFAWAAFPIPGVDNIVTDSQDFVSNQGGLISVIGAMGMGAMKLAWSHGESGAGHFIRGAAGGAVFGATPDLASYFVGG